ncbi:MAG: Tetratricopeptide repeat protein [Candidatus Omnitrophica bacterium ADurb.Bin205]|jgi:Ca-activated chloride channel family protein|nr:MAG: Tetratricopeptide repeat protein [Candidatus Omnitrophica bacterium ADurb.Bin205]
MSKRYGIITFFISLCIFAVVSSPCFAATDAKKNVREANRLYKQGKLDEALQKYNDASVALPDSDIVNFNMGTALYKKEDYQKAIDSFTKTLTTEDKKLEADALYNLGNCKYKLGKLKENTDLSATVGLLRESLDYYKRAVELDQKNTDARFNHEFVERELKVLLDKLKQQQSSSDKQKEQEQKQEEQKQGTCPTGKEQDKEDKEKEESAQGKEQQQQEKEGQEGQAHQEEKQQKEEQAAVEEAQQEEQGKELSEEGARALLERYGQDEATPDYIDKGARSYEREVLKDW